MNPDIHVAATATLADLALQIAQGQIGQKEEPTGSNKGPMVNEYLKAAGLNPGYAWCQAFVYWCYNEAAKKMNIPNPMVRTAGVYDCWNRTVSRNGVTKLLKPLVMNKPGLLMPGDQFILTFGRQAGHTGLVERVDISAKGAVIHTIEGNSNSNGGREGYEVARHTRNINDKALQGFIKYM